MGMTIPIKDKAAIVKMKNYYINVKNNPRNYLLLVFGMNTALRISDILRIKWEDIYDKEDNKYRAHITLHEQKTGKRNTFMLNRAVIAALDRYRKSFSDAPSGYLFVSNKGHDRPISRQQAFRIIKDAAVYAGFTEGVSCHSLRKTFGYYALKAGISPAIIMKIYNHSSFQITQRYLGIEQEEKDEIYMKINL